MDDGTRRDIERRLARIPRLTLAGRVRRCSGGAVTCAGLGGLVGIGAMCRIARLPSARSVGSTDDVMAEVVGIDGDDLILVPYGELDHVGAGATVRVDAGASEVRPDVRWLGRVVGPMGEPMDGGPPLPEGRLPYPLHARATPAHLRQALGDRLSLGVRALDLFTPCCRGQRLGIFAGSGVGKSMLLSMIARRSDADALVIGLIGERGRELGEFLTHTLGQEGRARSVVVAATSDMPAMLRRRAALLTMTVAESLRDQGLNVLCLVDSVTRYAMALREIHLAAGEPPTSRGYPPSVFAELPRLLERAGPGEGQGSITGLFTVLVEGDDQNEPVTDTVRGILDGHVVLDRAIAEGGRFPAVDVLRSLSRTAPGCYLPAERPSVLQARRLLRAHADMAELIQLGAYRHGSDPLLDEAIVRRPAIEALLTQDVAEPAGRAFERLAAALGMDG